MRLPNQIREGGAAAVVLGLLDPELGGGADLAQTGVAEGLQQAVEEQLGFALLVAGDVFGDVRGEGFEPVPAIGVGGGGGHRATLPHATGQSYRGLLGLEDSGDVGDGWHFEAPANNRVVGSTGATASTTVVEDGPLQATLEVTTTLRGARRLRPARAAPRRRVGGAAGPQPCDAAGR